MATGMIQIDGAGARVDLDYEQSWWDGQFLCFKSYDAAGRVILVRVAASVLMTELIGFIPPTSDFSGMAHPC